VAGLGESRAALLQRNDLRPLLGIGLPGRVVPEAAGDEQQ
jgi:hypothetical protein